MRSGNLLSTPHSRKCVAAPLDLTTKSVAISVGVMNRAEPLRQALATWRRLPHVSRIYVVDWGSRDPLRQILHDVLSADERLVIVRANQPHWQNARCHNLELQLAREHDLLLRLDADNLVEDRFFDVHPIEPGMFYAGNWRCAHGQNKSGLTGTLYADPKAILSVNGYNERLKLYGREDDDLYHRMRTAGLRRVDIDFGAMDHIQHDNRARYENLAGGANMQDLIGAYKAARRLNNSMDEINCLISMSRSIEVRQRWTTRDRRTAWDVTQLEPRYWLCEEKKA